MEIVGLLGEHRSFGEAGCPAGVHLQQVRFGIGSHCLELSLGLALDPRREIDPLRFAAVKR